MRIILYFYTKNISCKLRVVGCLSVKTVPCVVFAWETNCVPQNISINVNAYLNWLQEKSLKIQMLMTFKRQLCLKISLEKAYQPIAERVDRTVERAQWPLTKQAAGLTHWGRVTHICVSELSIIGSDNDLSPDRRQAIIWTNAGIL